MSGIRDAGAHMLFMILTGCSDSSLFMGSTQDNESAYYGDSGQDMASEYDDSDFLEPAWWRIHADIHKDEFGFGTESTIEFWFYDEALQPLCFVRNRLELIQSLPEPFQEAHLWWEVRLRPYSTPTPEDTGNSDPIDTGSSDTGISDTGFVDTGLDTASSQGSEDTAGEPSTAPVSDCPFEPVGMPHQFELGIGMMHPEIIAAWSDIDWGGGQEPLSSEPNQTAAYLSFQEDENIYVFGTAITESIANEDQWADYFGQIQIYSAYPFDI